mmetsp:Transcript_89571/g.253733  ORF Transcript_89571/g.253733 Transcript_89571/m.253733 type:complete len:216 (+) Transcript_89571:390-1037(+)
MTRQFQSVMQPSLSMPMIGALAVSMMFRNSVATRMASDFCWLSSVMSWPTPMTPVTTLSAPLRVVAFSRISRRLPSLVYSGNSKSMLSSPASALLSTPCTSSRLLSLMKLSTSTLPMVSSLLQPQMRADMRFHSLTWPSVSMPKMGALAVSMTRVRSSAICLLLTMAWRMFVMSWPTPTMPTTFPLASRRGVALSSSSTRLPFLVTSGNSKFAVS